MGRFIMGTAVLLVIVTNILIILGAPVQEAEPEYAASAANFPGQVVAQGNTILRRKIIDRIASEVISQDDRPLVLRSTNITDGSGTASDVTPSVSDTSSNDNEPIDAAPPASTLSLNDSASIDEPSSESDSSSDDNADLTSDSSDSDSSVSDSSDSDSTILDSYLDDDVGPINVPSTSSADSSDDDKTIEGIPFAVGSDTTSTAKRTLSDIKNV